MRRGTFCKKRVGPPDCRKNIFGFMWPLRPIDWFVGNGLDRSVLPCQKQDMAGKPRAIRRDFMRCARPDVRMGQDPSLQIFRKQTFSTRRLPPHRSRLISAAYCAEVIHNVYRLSTLKMLKTLWKVWKTHPLMHGLHDARAKNRWKTPKIRCGNSALFDGKLLHSPRENVKIGY